MVFVVSACGAPDEGEGTLRFTAYGEDFIEQEIPADEFVDGWSVEFSSFLVAVEGIATGETAVPGTFVAELASPSSGAGHILDEVAAPAGAAPTVTYTLAPASGDAMTDVDDATLNAMVDAGASVWARGLATKGDQSLSFDWPLAVNARYVGCETETKVGNEDVVDTLLTFHADHLFYDDLDLPEPNVAFDLIAQADTDADGEVTLAELEGQSLDGQMRYQVSGRNINDLYAFVLAQAQTLGHINGEGHCDIE